MRVDVSSRRPVDVLPPHDEALDQHLDLRVNQRLAAADAHHRRAALVDRGQALLDRHPLAHRAGVDAKAASKLTFEEALAQLEQIVDSMESGDVPLAELLAKFEDGNKLLKVCEARLKDAEMKIEQLKKQNDGIALTPFAPAKDSE